MNTRIKLFAALSAIALASGISSFFLLPPIEPGMTAMRPLPEARLASQGKLETLYMDWQAGQQRNGGNRNLLIALGWSRGLSLSSETTEARGLTRVDRLGGQIRVEIDGMDPA